MAEIDREKYASIGFVVKGGASPSRGPAEGKPRWRNKSGSRYDGATRDEVIERAREVAESPGSSERDVANAVRELTMFNADTGACWENFTAGVMAGNEALDKRRGVKAVITDKPYEESGGGSTNG